MAEKVILELEAKLGDAVKRLDGIESQLKDVGKEAKKSSKGIGGIRKALTGVGAVLTGGLFKAGAVIFEKLTELFMSNQVVVDAMSTAMNSLKIVFSDLVSFISNFSLPTFTELKDVVIAGVVDRFNQLMEVFGLIGESFMKLVNRDFKGAFETIKQAGKETVDVFTGQDKSFEKVTNSVKNYAKETFNQAKNLTNLNKQAEINQAINDKLLQQYDRDAELQRQIRDDVSLTIEERIAANVELGRILDEQQKVMMDNAAENVKIAKENLALDENNLDLQLALINAERELVDVEAHVTGLRAEQLTNTNALLQEQKDLKQEIIDKENEDRIAKEKQAEEDKKKEEEAKQKEIEEKERKAQEEADAILKAEEERKQKVANMMSDLDTVRMVAGEETKIGKALFIAKQGMRIKEQIAEAKKTLSGITLKAAESGVAAGQGTMETAKVGFPQNIPLLIAFAAQAAGIFASINSAVSAARSAAGSAGAGGGATPNMTPPPVPPAFNVVGQAPENQLAVALGENQNKPVKAFVVSNDVTNAQALDRNIVEQASIG